MKKKLLIISVVLGLLLTGCSTNSASTTNPAGSSPTETKGSYNFVIGAGHSGAGFAYVSAASDFFIPAVTEKAAELGYDVTFTEAYGGTIAPLADMFEATENGQVDIGLCAVCFEPTKAMLLNYNGYIPFSSPDIALTNQVGKMIYDDNKEAIDNMLAQYNIKYIALGAPIASYHLLTNFKVKGIDDLQGHKIAAAGANLSLLSNTGAVGVQSNLNEAYTSLQTGVYEGWIVWPGGVASYKLDEVAPYYLKTDFGACNYCYMFMNMDVWDSLPEDLQGVIMTAADEEYGAKGVQRAIDEDNAGFEAIKANGTQMLEITKEERDKWINAIDDPAVQAIKELEAAGLPGKKVFKDFYDFAAQLGYEATRRFGE